MMGLTHAQAKLLSYIKVHTETADGIPPTFEEMKEAMGLKSRSGVHRLITALEERGFIRRLRNRARALEVVEREIRPPLSQYATWELLREINQRAADKQGTRAVQ